MTPGLTDGLNKNEGICGGDAFEREVDVCASNGLKNGASGSLIDVRIAGLALCLGA